jgi:hypothetical protein
MRARAKLVSSGGAITLGYLTGEMAMPGRAAFYP